MRLIIGLGNIGSIYDNTRHNVGFDIVNSIHEEFNFGEFTKFKNSLVSVGVISSQKVMLLKPTTYMNASGIAASEAISFYKMNINDAIVIHDDMDIECGKVKFKFAGGSAGHNGIKSIDKYVGQSYWRLRVGISKPIFGDISNYVLGKFNKEQMVCILDATTKITKNIEMLLLGNKDQFMNSLN